MKVANRERVAESVQMVRAIVLSRMPNTLNPPDMALVCSRHAQVRGFQFPAPGAESQP
jgi:hypothetical protein